jgi:hypothetical protein
MRFLMLVKTAEGRGMPPKELMDEISKLGQQNKRNGKMLDSGGLAPTAASTKVRVSGGKVMVIDGPFAEAKEVVGGFAMFEFPSKEDALASAKKFMELHVKYWPGWEGETEVRQVFGEEEFRKVVGKVSGVKRQVSGTAKSAAD